MFIPHCYICDTAHPLAIACNPVALDERIRRERNISAAFASFAATLDSLNTNTDTSHSER